MAPSFIVCGLDGPRDMKVDKVLRKEIKKCSKAKGKCRRYAQKEFNLDDPSEEINFETPT